MDITSADHNQRAAFSANRRAISKTPVGWRLNIARIIVARMLLRSIFKMLKDKVRFNQVSAA